jgi:hypothetical protein
MRIQVPKIVTRSVGKQILVLKKNSPHILFAAGVVGVVGGTVLACRSTLKLEETLDDIKTDIEKVKAAENLTKSEHDRLLMLKYGRGVVKIGRLYGPPVVVGGVSIALITGSHIQLTRRNNALGAALVAMSQAYSDYRDRVRAELGEEKEREIFINAQDQEVEINGKKQIIKSVGPGGGSPYARIFDPSSYRWENDPEINRIVLKAQQNYFNNKLNVEGHLFLNEVYHELGLETSQAGQFVGWLLDGNGDGYVTIGIDDVPNGVYEDGVEVGILLDFNVDGDIHNLVKWRG